MNFENDLRIGGIEDALRNLRVFEKCITSTGNHLGCFYCKKLLVDEIIRGEILRAGGPNNRSRV